MHSRTCQGITARLSRFEESTAFSVCALAMAAPSMKLLFTQTRRHNFLSCMDAGAANPSDSLLIAASRFVLTWMRGLLRLVV